VADVLGRTMLVAPDIEREDAMARRRLNGTSDEKATTIDHSGTRGSMAVPGGVGAGPAHRLPGDG
jgi:hypothetical protein